MPGPEPQKEGARPAARRAIDGSGGFYRGHALPESRSRMNVTFRLPSEALEKQFLAEAQSAGMVGLPGHRSVGGVRASVSCGSRRAIDATSSASASVTREMFIAAGARAGGP